MHDRKACKKDFRQAAKRIAGQYNSDTKTTMGLAKKAIKNKNDAQALDGCCVNGARIKWFNSPDVSIAAALMGQLFGATDVEIQDASEVVKRLKVPEIKAGTRIHYYQDAELRKVGPGQYRNVMSKYRSQVVVDRQGNDTVSVEDRGNENNRRVPFEQIIGYWPEDAKVASMDKLVRLV